MLALTGCGGRQQAIQTDIFQRELRLQEDEIYRLEDLIEEYQSIIRDYRCEVADLQRDLEEANRSDSGGSEPEASAGTLEPTPADDPPMMLAPPSQTEPDATADDLIEMPDDLPATEMVPAPAAEPDGEAPAFTPSGASLLHDSGAADVQQASSSVQFTPPRPFPHRVTEMARPLAEPTKSGADGLTLTISPRDGASGELIAKITDTRPAALSQFAGTVALMLVDPSTGDTPRRVARWDFDRSEVAGAWRFDTDADGPHLELPIGLPANLPTDRPLRLWVRLVDRDGEKQLTSTVVSL